MADRVPDDGLAEAFTRFRAEVREEIRPPGSDAVRHSVRRRRTIRVACAAAAVALVGASVAVATMVDSLDRIVPAVERTLSAPELEELATQARNAMQEEPVAFGFSTAVTARTQGETRSLDHSGSSPLRFVQGDDYDLVALCLGRGMVTVAWEAPGGPTGSFSVVCGGETVRVRFTPRADGPSVQIRLAPDAEATGRAGIAVAIIEFH